MSETTYDPAAIRRVSGALHPAERDVSVAIASSARLTLGLVQAQVDLGISPIAAAPVLRRVHAAQARCLDGLDELVAAHRLIKRIADGIGIPPQAYGGGVYKGDDALMPDLFTTGRLADTPASEPVAG